MVSILAILLVSTAHSADPWLYLRIAPPAAQVAPAAPAVDGDEDEDADGLSTAAEQRRGTDPRDPDSDSDGLSDGEEVMRGLDPLDPDTDDDGLHDGAEVRLGCRPLSPDSDGDGLTDGEEVAAGLSPLLADSDQDAIPDQEERLLGLDPLNPDTDGDGLADGAEQAAGLSPLLADTDGDGQDDGTELRRGQDPLRWDAPRHLLAQAAVGPLRVQIQAPHRQLLEVRGESRRGGGRGWGAEALLLLLGLAGGLRWLLRDSRWWRLRRAWSGLRGQNQPSAQPITPNTMNEPTKAMPQS